MNFTAHYLQFSIFDRMLVAPKRPLLQDVDFTSDSVDGFLAPSASKQPAIPPLFAPKPLLPPIPTPSTVPQNPTQLATLLLDVESVRRLLASRLPLKQLRSLLFGCYMQYHAVRENLKDSDSNFFIDKVIHVNRDGVRFKHCRDNSYRSILKLKEPECGLGQKQFALWLRDMQQWNESLPYVDVLASRISLIRQTVASLPPEEKPLEPETENIKKKKPVVNRSTVPLACTVTRGELTKLVITTEEMVKLIDYGREVFDRTVTGFYTQIRAPPNPPSQQELKEQKTKPASTVIFMDQIIGISWATRPYMMFQRPLTILLKFRHFRDERICQLPFWNKKEEGVSEEVYKKWLNDMQQWDEEYPTHEYIEQKAAELSSILAEPPRGPPVDVLKLAALEAQRENSTKLLKIIMEWQQEHQNANAAPPFPHPPYPARFPYPPRVPGGPAFPRYPYPPAPPPDHSYFASPYGPPPSHPSALYHQQYPPIPPRVPPPRVFPSIPPPPDQPAITPRFHHQQGRASQSYQRKQSWSGGQKTRPNKVGRPAQAKSVKRLQQQRFPAPKSFHQKGRSGKQFTHSSSTDFTFNSNHQSMGDYQQGPIWF